MKLWLSPLIFWFLGGTYQFLGAQTQVNLSTQSKSANISNEGPTKPIQTGTTLPALCSTGQMFFLTTAIPGANLYACTATNIWSAIAGGGGGGALSAGSGIVITQSGGSSTLSVDTTLLATKPFVQATTANIVTLTSTSGSTLTASGNPTLLAYSNGQLVELFWNTSCVSGAKTLSIDSLAAVSLYEYDGVTLLPTTYCTSGTPNLFSYDGTLRVFRLMAGGH